VDVGPNGHAGFVLSGLTEATTYHVSVKAMNDAGLSEECSNILSGWPTPRVDNLVVSPPLRLEGLPVPTWRVTLSINGHNFKEEGQSYYTDYPGLTIISFDQPSNKLLTLVMQYDINTPAGEASIIIVNHDGANCDPRPEVGYTGCVAVEAATVLIQPTLLPGRVANLDWWVP
jgi:hypothetical protein